MKYSYDDLGRPVMAERYREGSLLSTSNYLYDARGRLEREELLTAGKNLKDYVVYTFNAKDQVVRYNQYTEWYDSSLLLAHTTTCAYDTSGQLITVTEYDIRSNKPAYASAITYTYQDTLSQITAEVYDQNKKKVKTMTLVYDEMKSPLAAVPAFRATVLTPGFPHEHNIKRCTVQDAGGNTIRSESFERALTYTAAKYVESSTTTYLEGGKTTASYTYQCL